MEDFLPTAMPDSALAAAASVSGVRLGVLLSGEGGGEWVICLEGRSLSVEPGPRDEAAFTIIQTVEDWRGALWEGRGGIFGQQAIAIFEAGGAGSGRGASAAGNPEALGQLAALDGVIKVVVTDGPGGDWSTAFKLGPGVIPDEPTTRVTLSAEDAEAMRNGSLDAMQAFMSGRIQIAGDMALVMQMVSTQIPPAS